jgi:hypothetical protein
MINVSSWLVDWNRIGTYSLTLGNQDSQANPEEVGVIGGSSLFWSHFVNYFSWNTLMVDEF